MTMPLDGITVAVPESRELDLFARMLEQRGARTWRCPLVNIRDAPDPAPVEAWLRRFIETPPEELILLTGEGVKRLHGFAERAGWAPTFLAALGQTRIIARGPKPGRALRPFGHKPEVVAKPATTPGVIKSLEDLALRDHRVGVQLYGTEPNLPLMDALRRGGATPDPVAPYVYADDVATDAVATLIDDLAGGQIDVLAFTSKTQVKRLVDVARRTGRMDALERGLTGTLLAAVGPVAADEIRRLGHEPQLVPEDSYFMKPLVREIVAWRDSTAAG